MKPLVCSLILLVSFHSLSIRAQDTDEEPPHPIDIEMDRAMERDPSTAGHLEATDAALESWNALLNDSYQSLMGSLGEEAKTKLRRSQQTWILWRDLEIEALEAIYGEMDGTMWTPAQAYAVMKLTRERALRLVFFLSLKGPDFSFVIRNERIEISPSTHRGVIKQIFQRVAPEATPSVDRPEFLQYDLVLTFGQAPASFVFDFNKAGTITQIRMDAFNEAQIPTVTELIKDLRDEEGAPEVKNGAMVWEHAGWTFTHHSGGEGEDSTFSMIIKRGTAD